MNVLELKNKVKKKKKEETKCKKNITFFRPILHDIFSF